MAFADFRAGYLDIGDTRVSMVQGSAGLRIRVIGPLDVSVFGEMGERAGHHDDGDDTFDFELSHQLVGVGVGLAF